MRAVVAPLAALALLLASCGDAPDEPDAATSDDAGARADAAAQDAGTTDDGGPGADAAAGVDAGPDPCGDGVCDGGETCGSCAEDCGACVACAPTGAADCATCTDCVWVATDGDDGADGSRAAPFATIQHAVESVPAAGGVTVCVEEGTYSGTIEIEAEFEARVYLRAATRYRATLTAPDNPALDLGGSNLTIEGFEIVGQPTTGETSGLVYMWGARGVVFHDNVVHDTYYNDLFRILNTDDVTLSCNLLYNQAGSDEHVDINGGARNTYFRDNVFFNDYAASGRAPPGDVHSFIVIKTSNLMERVSGAFFLQRNLFMHYEGGSKPMLRIGSDGEAYHEAEDVLIENNLMLFNGPEEEGAFEILDAARVTVRANTFHGDASGDELLGLIGTGEGSPPSEDVTFVNNVFSRPDGALVALSVSPPEGVIRAVTSNNLYFHGGASFPTSADVIDRSNDARAVDGDPVLADPGGVTMPTLDGAGFVGGYGSVREVFVDFVERYGAIGAGSAAIDAADASAMPEDDILGTARGASPDIGAFER